MHYAAAFFYLCLNKKYRSGYQALMTLILAGFWYWRFFGRLRWCF
ncbi:DUF2645 family protein [Affinibrenneria salicis]|uniref:DUF2645 family protein n=1 Tax=Affinibrenneria salicis TaxID=2590031 RepID=A0A5J5G7Y5_9GAMM|nr:DUF2645 family protein [Affinibrenneria salicis]KAA9003329.1 DUF2645 family protein [Affinibrenneria salicis]